MARRTGAGAIQEVARKMCKLIVAFSPIIRRVFPENANLHLALESAMTACSILEQELEAVKAYGD